MHTYVKGARSERELLNRFHSMGYSVLRSAGSGVNSLSPDIVVIKDGICLSFECKAWERESLALDAEQYEKLVWWRDNTEFPTYVGWRMNGAGWYFIELSEFEKGERSGNWNITRKKVLQSNRRLEDVF